MKNIYAKAILILVLCAEINQNINAQVRTKMFVDEVPAQLIPINKSLIIPEEIIIKEPSEFLNLLNQGHLKTEVSGEYSNKFAIPVKVDLDVLSISKVTEEKNTTTFAITINAGKALNISLQFDRFLLSEHSVLSIYTKNELTDSITANENNENKVWATRVYQGNKLTLVLRLPTEEKSKAILNINQINFGFKKFGGEYFGRPGTSAACNINVLCPEGNGWQNERNSVALIVANGVESCSGALIMNACGTNIPYLLTANHCLAAGNVPNWVFQFQYWSATCTPNSGWNETIQFNGCTLRASSAASDFALLQLNQTPQPTSGIFYSGWSRIGAPNGSVCLHYPEGDLMKFSRDFDLSSISSWGGTNNMWYDVFDQGIVQKGSSGAPLYDLNHRIVGQLQGYKASTCVDGDNTCFCNEPHAGEFGRFDLSWTGGGTNTSRLSNWLDPNNTGAVTTNTTNISALTNVNLSITGNTLLCTQQTYSVNTTLPVTWSSTPSGFVSFSCQNCNSTVATRSGTSYVTITATINPGCGAGIAASKVISVGSPVVVTSTPNGPCRGATQSFLLSASPYTNGTNWNWSIAHLGSGSSIYIYSPTSPSTPADLIGQATLVLYYNDLCGVAQQYGVILNSTCHALAVIAPDPATNVVTVSTTSASLLKSSSTTPTELQWKIYQINILNQQGNLLKAYSYPSGISTINIDLSSLSNGTYTLQTYDNSNWTSQQIVILR